MRASALTRAIGLGALPTKGAAILRLLGAALERVLAGLRLGAAIRLAGLLALLGAGSVL